MRKGSHMSTESIKKISESKKKKYAMGYTNFSKGKTYEELYGKIKADAIKEKCSCSHKGYKMPIAQRIKIGEKSKGRNAGDKNPAKRPEVRNKISNTLKRKYRLGIIKHPRGMLGKTPASKGKTWEEIYGETRAAFLKKQCAESNKGRKWSKTERAKRAKNIKSNPNYGMRNKHHSDETKKHWSQIRRGKNYEVRFGIKKARKVKNKMSNTAKKQWQNKEYKDKHLKANCRRPNIPENIFISICIKYNLPYKYVGNGSFWIENINPDFINVNGEKICVEIFGDYWHNYPNGTQKDKEKEKILEKYGWKRIIIWENELKKLKTIEILQKLGMSP